MRDQGQSEIKFESQSEIRLHLFNSQLNLDLSC